MQKYKDLLNSSRFQQLLIIAILQSLVVFNVISSDQGVQLINIISALFGASVVVRTVDRQSDVQANGTVVNISSAPTTATKTSKKK